ncbi:allophanate hydrolase subunit 1 [Paenibacillus xerothermodurans]|uniref:Allophanate hydrolase subunit 1 n=2 Tax=Paenibacillus xerothermodurans TaxID=1977292 RepID=A0A2W1NWY0_PAEXE|nr:allophanate hydrolase subunit 1 [Paenibacillus xerothermodurans]
MSPLGESAIRIELGTGIDPRTHRKVKALREALEQHAFPGMIECIPAFTSVTVLYDPLQVRAVSMGRPDCKARTSYELVCAAVQQIAFRMDDGTDHQPRVVEIPVCYGGEFGPDLHVVAGHNQMTAEEVIDIHTGGEYLVYMIGFAPGFPYLGGMSERIATPRRAAPRTSIPEGTVGIAGMQTGVYPISTPGGWQLIGRTPLQLFRPHDNPPSLLQSGDIVKFRSISLEEFEQYREDSQ